MRKHDCGCTTEWSDELNHPVYGQACGMHRRRVPDGWMKPKPARVRKDLGTREPVQTSA